MWDHRCKILHKNYLSNKIQNLENIDRGIRSLLHKDVIALFPHERRVFYITEIEIFSKIPNSAGDAYIKPALYITPI